jgi:hypothetical protein
MQRLHVASAIGREFGIESQIAQPGAARDSGKLIFADET